MRRPFDIRRANPFGALLSLRKYPVVLWLMLALFLFTTAAQAFPSVYNYFTIEVFHFSLVADRPHARPVRHRLRAVPGVRRRPAGQALHRDAGGGGRHAGGGGGLHRHRLHPQLRAGVYVYIVIGAVSGLAAPAINGVLSRQVPDNAQGELQGAVNAANSLATIIGPLAATQIFAYFTYGEGSPGYFPGAPFIGAAVADGRRRWCCSRFIALRFDLGHKPSVADAPAASPRCRRRARSMCPSRAPRSTTSCRRTRRRLRAEPVDSAGLMSCACARHELDRPPRSSAQKARNLPSSGNSRKQIVLLPDELLQQLDDDRACGRCICAVVRGRMPRTSAARRSMAAIG